MRPTRCLLTILLMFASALLPAARVRAAAIDRYYPAAQLHAVTLAADECHVHLVCADQAEVHLAVGGGRNGAMLRSVGDVEIRDTLEDGTLHLKVSLRRPAAMFAVWTDVRLDLSLPLGTRISVSVEDGEIEGRDLNGGASLSTREGNIHLEGAEGAIALTTVGGTAFARGLSGSLNARTIDGKIDAAGRFQDVRAVAEEGAIRIHAAEGSRAPGDSAGGGWVLDTSSGDIELRLPETIDARLRARSGSGDVDLGSGPAPPPGNREPGWITRIFATGRGQIQLTSRSGSITLR